MRFDLARKLRAARAAPPSPLRRRFALGAPALVASSAPRPRPGQADQPRRPGRQRRRRGGQHLGDPDRRRQERAGYPDLPKGTPFDDMFDQFFKTTASSRRSRGRTRCRRSARASSSTRAAIVITNNHVIGDANDIVVTSPTAAS